MAPHPLRSRTLQVASIGAERDVARAVYIYESRVSVRSLLATDVPIQISAADAWGDKDGRTQFFRAFELGTRNVRFTAPLEHGGLRFYRWHLNGVGRSIGARTLTLDMDTLDFRTITAQYGRFLMGTHVKIGGGCAGSNGRATLAPRYNPNIGLTTQYRLVAGPRLSGTALMIGARSQNLRLAPTDCHLWLVPAVFLPTATDATGFANTSLRIPNDTGLIGRSIYTQYLNVDPTANALAATTSDGYKTTIGGWKLR